MDLYADADGEIYSERYVGHELETGAWTAHAWDITAGALVVETSHDDLVWLVTLDVGDLPDDFDVESLAGDSSLEGASDP